MNRHYKAYQRKHIIDYIIWCLSARLIWVRSIIRDCIHHFAISWCKLLHAFPWQFALITISLTIDCNLSFSRQIYSLLLQVQLLDSLPHPLQTPFLIGFPHFLHGVHPHAWHIFLTPSLCIRKCPILSHFRIPQHLHYCQTNGVLYFKVLSLFLDILLPFLTSLRYSRLLFVKRLGSIYTFQ